MTTTEHATHDRTSAGGTAAGRTTARLRRDDHSPDQRAASPTPTVR
jgi:hypothetical protein